MTHIKKQELLHPLYANKTLLTSAFILISIGLVMVASASSPIAQVGERPQLYFFYKQLMFLSLGVFLGGFILRIPMSWWEKNSHLFLILSVILLVFVLIPGVGRTLNGSRRWLNFGLFGFQVSEFAKLSFILYLASFLSRHLIEVRQSFLGFIKPLMLAAPILFLLLCEPDFGASAVIVSLIMGVLFLAGVKWRHFLAVLFIVSMALYSLAVFSPYRWQRLTSFLDPWADPFGSGYQLTQALIAFGRGGFWGVGLGDSLQKQFYLPEAQTDFIFAVMAEELGFIGLIFVILLFALLVYEGLKVANMAYRQKNTFNAFVGYGVSLYFAMGALVNMGVTCGLLPTKGLTLPLMSYGGSSLLINMICIMLLLRIAFENQVYPGKSYAKTQ